MRAEAPRRKGAVGKRRIGETGINQKNLNDKYQATNFKSISKLK
jgi:hypothetical protein